MNSIRRSIARLKDLANEIKRLKNSIEELDRAARDGVGNDRLEQRAMFDRLMLTSAMTKYFDEGEILRAHVSSAIDAQEQRARDIAEHQREIRELSAARRAR